MMKLKGQIFIILALVVLVSTLTLIPVVTRNMILLDDIRYDVILDYKLAVLLIDSLAYTTSMNGMYNANTLVNGVKEFLENYSKLTHKYYGIILDTSRVTVNSNIPIVIPLNSTKSVHIEILYSDNRVSLGIHITINATLTPTITKWVYYDILLVRVNYTYQVNSLKFIVPLVEAYMVLNRTIVYGYIEVENDYYMIYFPLPSYTYLNRCGSATLHLIDSRGVVLWCILDMA